MNLRCHLISLSAFMVWSVPAYSQDESLETLVEKSRVEMKASRWEQALEAHTQVVGRFGQDQPLKKYGAQFGVIFYHKGVCEMKLKKWVEAMQSFEICYRDFPNDRSLIERGNPFQIMALCKWGESAMAAENWELAASRFAKFLSERERTRDQVPLGSFYVNLSICEYRRGRLAEGNENLEIAIQNKENFPTPESGILAGFQALVGAAISLKDERVLLDFVSKNRGALILDSSESLRNSRVFLKLAGDAMAAGMMRAALIIYQLVPTSEVEGVDPPASVRLAAIALIHEKSGNVRGAYAAYRQLEQDYPTATKREDHLYQLVRTASIIGEHDSTRRYARKLYQEYPKSVQITELRAMGLDFTNEASIPEPVKILPAKATVAPVDAPPKSREFAEALDLYQGRKYQDAQAAFSAIKAPAKTAALAAYYEAECMRKLGNLNDLAKALKEISKHSSLGEAQEKQLEVSALWSLVSLKNWEQIERATEKQIDERLLGDLRAQVAYFYGLALQKQGRPFEALNAYNIAMTADAGTSEETSRQAALRVLEIHRADLEVQEAIKNWGPAHENVESPGLFRLREAAAVAVLFEESLGAGVSLPSELSEFLKYKNR